MRVRALIGKHLDTLCGAVVGAGALGTALASGAVRGVGREILVMDAALSLAALGIVAAALTVVVVFFGEEYVVILESTRGGMKGAFRPYFTGALMSAVSTLVASFMAMAYPAAPAPVEAAFLGVSMGLLTTAIVGVVQLVELTGFHGAKRAAILKGIRDNQTLRSQRMRDTG